MTDQTDQEFADFATSVQGRLLRLADLLCGDRGRAEDLVQHALIKVYLAWPKLRTGDPESYGRTVITRANIDWWRRQHWRERPSGAALPEPAGTSGEHAADLAQRDAVLRALACLTAKERAVIALRYYCDLSEAEAAREAGIAVGTVKSTCARALAKLKNSPHLQEEGMRP